MTVADTSMGVALMRELTWSVAGLFGSSCMGSGTECPNPALPF